MAERPNSWPRESTSKSPIEGVSMLKYGPNNNFREVKKQLNTHLSTKYGWMSRIVERSEYYTPPEIRYDAKRLEEDRMYAKDIEVRVTARSSLIVKMDQLRPEVYGITYTRRRGACASYTRLR